jgi:hypothetical protein
MPTTFVRDPAMNALMLRGVELWVVLRIAFAVLYPVLQASPSPLAVVGLCAILGLIDISRRRERALWGDLGIARRAIGIVFASAAVVGEITLQAVGL